MNTTVTRVELDTERVRSNEYISRTRQLLELVEMQLNSEDGHLISLEGLNKLRQKVDQF